MPLAEATIKSTKAAEKPRKLFDGGGLYLLIAPSGGKHWRLKYRFGGKEKSLSLGAYPEVTLAAARKLRDEARAFLIAGVDPSEVRKQERGPFGTKPPDSMRQCAFPWTATGRCQLDSVPVA